MRSFTALFFASLLALGLGACGSDEGGGGCPGITCTNCGAFGDCDVTCSPGQVETCIGHPNGDPNLRCAYCG